MIAIDFETSCNGKAEFRFWRQGFQIDSIACSWRDQGELKSWFSNKPKEVDAMIRRLAELNSPLVVHNLGFEMGVLMKLYPDLKFNWSADTMRLAQLLDNGGSWRDFVFKTADDLMDELLDDEKASTRSGLSLEAVASRFLPKDRQNHKAIAYKWLEDNHQIKSNHGSHLHLLPYEQLKEYNIADTEVTLLLYEELTEQLKLLDFDWSQDWTLYTTRCRLMQGAYIRGLKIDRDRLRKHIYKVDQELKAILDEFMDKTKEAREEWARKYPGKIKSRPTTPDSFNIGSNQQLARLFIECLGIVGGRTTAKGQKKVEGELLTPDQAARDYPSFASKHLHLWGPLGEILYRRRKKLLVLQQMLGVLLGSEESGRLHPEVRVSGTKTNRVSGGRGE